MEDVRPDPPRAPGVPIAEPTQAARTGRLIGRLLLVLLVLSFGLRVWDASKGLHAGRYFDERFPFRNVTSILRGEIRPRHTYYLSLSYLPQAAVMAASQGLHRLTGAEALSIFSRKAADGYSPTAYMIGRGCNVVFGVLSLWVTFLIGRRIQSPWLGLLAAAILAAFHRHVLSSAEFKPDILVLLLTAVTCYWAIAAAYRPSLGRFLRAGAGVGLAVSAKYTGIAACFPVVGAALAAAAGMGGRRDRRSLGWLLLAGAASVVTFVALNPFLGLVLKYIPRLTTGYAQRGAAEKSTHWTVFLRQVDFLVVHHGVVTSLFLLAGLLLLLWRLFRPAARDTAEWRLGWVVVLSQLLGYSLFHSAATTLFRGQNYLPVAPFSSLVAAWGMVEAWRLLTRRAPALAGRRAAVAVWSLAGALLVGQQFAVVYLRVVPSNWEVARQILHERLPEIELRHVAHEQVEGTLRLGGRSRALTTEVARLDQLAPALLDVTDAEVFPESRLDSPGGEFYRRRLERLPEDRVLRVASRPFRSRGETVVILLHPWERDAVLGPVRFQRPEPGANHVMAALPPGMAAGDVVSLILWVPRRAPGLDHLQLAPGDRRQALDLTARRKQRHRLGTPRFVLAEGETAVKVASPPRVRVHAYELEILRWHPEPQPARP
ncbi:MAG TPA: glycosyltransferase family 39 protein [Thermoanaerobaculia bacterium]|nr:glycosyltransferase family 39 protein [Thermoanaerobaculia bacterium]